MLTDEDLEKIAMLLEAYGLKKPAVLKAEAAAIRMRRMRERKRNAAVTESVTKPQAKRNGRRNGAVTTEAPSKTTWTAYSTAYRQRYGAEPVRNAAVNGTLAQFVGRIGAAEAPLVAAFYLTHNGRYYVQEMHSVAAMLRNAEKLRTEWVTQRTMTETEARQGDRTEALGNVFKELKEEAKHGRH